MSIFGPNKFFQMKTIEKVITPIDKPIISIFSNQQSYSIDIYQREYKWDETNVSTLLNDIELRFITHDKKKSDPTEIKTDVIEKFAPYFLNSFLIHKTSTDAFIVDGQQRLTTFLLMFIKFYHIIDSIKSVEKTFDLSFIKELIYEKDPFGNPTKFKIHNPNREAALKALIDKDENFNSSDVTQKRILENYKIVGKYLDNFFAQENDPEKIDVVKFNYYVSYLLYKIVIIEIEITKTSNVSMIFEVVNDRGRPLESYEILKGKLMGILEGDLKEKANNIWSEMLKKHDDNGLSVDEFFKLYLRSKFANSETDYEKFERKYHFEIYKNNEIRKFFGNFENQDILYERISKDIKYFSDLHIKIRTTEVHKYIVCNRILEQNQQNLLLMSCIKCNDKNEEEKLKLLPKKFDQFHVFLRLIELYDSNEFQIYIHKLNKELREINPDKIFSVFDNLMLKELEGEYLEEGKYKKIESLFELDRLKNINNKWTNFTKYILMRMDLSLSKLLGDKPTYAKGMTWKGTNEIAYEHIFNKNSRRVAGLHLEHIFTHNEKNYELFKDKEGIFDSNKFYQVRNKYGAILLLKDKHNLSSNNDIYSDKFETYKNSDIILNELLVGSVPLVDVKKLPSNISFKIQNPDGNGLFPLSGVNERQKEVINMINYIWGEKFEEDFIKQREKLPKMKR